jgi:hypothetical protein
MKAIKATKKFITVTSTAGLNLATIITNLCLSARDIPQQEKENIVTGLPKSEGSVFSTDNIRPISVGPIFGRLINKLVATRLGRTFALHPILDPAQFAFLPGKSIHEPIDTIIKCFTQSRDAPDSSLEKPCYAIFYDISKAYDTICWSSISRALRRIGAPAELIEFVASTLLGTTLRMRTNISGRVTPSVQLHKAIKQGCPLAPLLFAIIMDELHANYRAIGGYKLRNGPTVSSRGYCDDTVILASDLATLTRLHQATHDFFALHNLKLNTGKSYITGRHFDGTPLTESLDWPTTNLPLAIKTPNESVRYLGAYLNMDLDWSAQLKALNVSVMALISCLKYRRLTPLQGYLLLKEVLSQKLDIGFRHAHVPKVTLANWDMWLSNALINTSGLPSKNVHHSTTFTVARALTFSYQYLSTKALHFISNL